MKILFITFGLPTPPSSGARIRDYNLITRLARKHEVSVLSLLELASEADHFPDLLDVCQHVDGVLARRSFVGTLGVALQGLLCGRPAATAPYYFSKFAKRISELTTQQDFDIVQVEHSFLAPYRSAINIRPGGTTVLSFHNIGVQQYRSMMDMGAGFMRIPAALKWLMMRGWETRLARKFDAALVVSKQDGQRLEALDDSLHIYLIENGVDCNQLQVLAEPDSPDTDTDTNTSSDLIFVGTMGYLPNRDAMRYFCNQVLPIIRQQHPECHLTIVGSGGLEHLPRMVRPGVVEVAGRVDDLIPYYQRARLAIVPLRSGGGSRLKILEAMALGRPVVSTRMGCEGLELEPGRDLLVADDPQAFAQAVIQLIDSPQYRQTIAQAARQTVQSRYDWDLIADRLLEVYSALQESRTPRP